MRTYPNANDPKSVVTLEVDDVFFCQHITQITRIFFVLSPDEPDYLFVVPTDSTKNTNLISV